MQSIVRLGNSYLSANQIDKFLTRKGYNLISQTGLITNDQELAELAANYGNRLDLKNITAAIVCIDNGDYAHIWVTFNPRPYELNRHMYRKLTMRLIPNRNRKPKLWQISAEFDLWSYIPRKFESSVQFADDNRQIAIGSYAVIRNIAANLKWHWNIDNGFNGVYCKRYYKNPVYNRKIESIEYRVIGFYGSKDHVLCEIKPLAS